MEFIPVLRTNYPIADSQECQSPVQAVAEGAGFVATANLFSLLQLLFCPNQKRLRRKLLGRLRSRVVDLSDHPITISVNVDPQLDALGFNNILCLSLVLGIGVGFVFYHTNLGVARFRSPANTHAIYQEQC
jgi:hypothetical protein